MTPAPLRKLKAEMVLKDLSLGDVARKARIPYTSASAILNGKRVDPKSLKRLERVITTSPMPEEAGA